MLVTMFDTHCHLTFPDFSGAVHRTLDECEEAGVTGVITVSTTPDDAAAALALAEQDDRVWCTAGVHPLYADRAEHDWSLLVDTARQERCLAWGELGLDNYYDDPRPERQRAVLARHLEVIEQSGLDLPVVLHCREAFGDLIPAIRDARIAPERVVFHCFTGTPDDMRQLLDFGAYVSFTGVLTYRNAPEVREAAKLVPLDRVMFETDAPYLTPEPHRKIRPNHPRFSRVTAEFFADLRGVPWAALHDQINRTTERFYGVPTVS